MAAVNIARAGDSADHGGLTIRLASSVKSLVNTIGDQQFEQILSDITPYVCGQGDMTQAATVAAGRYLESDDGRGLVDEQRARIDGALSSGFDRLLAGAIGERIGLELAAPASSVVAIGKRAGGASF